MRPNILFIMSDDHAAHAISAYGSQINHTPNIDRIGHEGVRFDHCFCTNSICAPSRATILTGLYNHENGVRTLVDKLDGRLLNFPQLLQAAGYQTAIIGKWHLGHGWPNDPTGFDFWKILPGQGEYFDPTMYEMGTAVKVPGYVTDVITDASLKWLEERDPDRPFLLMCHHKAPHRPWQPDAKHQHMYDDLEIAAPETFDDDYRTRKAAQSARMRVERDLGPEDLKAPIPEGLSADEEKMWKYQRYIKDYLRCIASIDDNVGRVLEFLDQNGLTENTIVVYTSDQGFFLGDHGWYDKRFMYEESLRMPLLVRYPKEIAPETVTDAMVLNVDFAPSFLDWAGIPIPRHWQGRSLRAIAQGNVPDDWRHAMYYRYWMHMDAIHGVWAHYGIRTEQYKLIHYYGEALGTTGSEDISTPKTWELFDLAADPYELRNLYDDPSCQALIADLKEELQQLQTSLHDLP